MDLYFLLVIIHVIGAVIGVGAATMGDILFFKSLKDGALEKKELEFLKTISAAVWAGLFILVFSGFGFFLVYRVSFPETGLIYNPTYLIKLTIAAVIFFNGLFMHWKVFPLLESQVGRTLNNPDFLSRAQPVFTSGAISIVSWYSALILGAARGIDASYFSILVVYLVVLWIGIVFANIIGKRLIRSL